MITEKSELAGRSRESRHRNSVSTALVAFVASIWLYHGLFNKLFRLEPRHLLIVQAVPGLAGDTGKMVLCAIGAGEMLLAAWVVSGLTPRWCAAAQTIALLSMNVAELIWARAYLVSPAALLPVNIAFLAVAWLTAELQRATPGMRFALPLHRLRRHPLPVRAFFRDSLVLTYAFPRHVLEPLLPPGLELDTYGEYGFIAVAMVQTQDLRPAFLARAVGRNFVLTGYRIFTKFRHDGRTRRGLRIVRSDANRWDMVIGGNLLTHYDYRKCDAEFRRSDDGRLVTEIRTPSGAADVRVVADLRSAGALPAGSPFKTVHDARRFAGPLPYTFDYEPQTHSIIAIRGVRENWRPALVNVDVQQLSFFEQPLFAGVRPILASAFYVHDIPYRWERGVRFSLAEEIL